MAMSGTLVSLISDRSGKDSRRLVLGTAQLGMDYGIANTSGKPDMGRAEAIIAQAWESGIRIFDTAQGYGNSEEVLGRALAELGLSDQALVITKLDPRVDLADRKALHAAVDQSLNNLGLRQLAGLLLHSEDQLEQWSNRAEKVLRELIDSGKVAALGVSVYTPARASQALGLDLMDLVQLPANILDHRFEQAGIFEKARETGRTVLIRSVFLQGLLLMEPEKVPDRVGFVRPLLNHITNLASASGLGQRELALGHIKFNYPDALVLFGAERPEQVAANAATWESLVPERVPVVGWDFGEDIEERVVNPSLWPS